jgi:hypothetical protein
MIAGTTCIAHVSLPLKIGAQKIFQQLTESNFTYFGSTLIRYLHPLYEFALFKAGGLLPGLLCLFLKFALRAVVNLFLTLYSV